ncbi:unnamed protein product (macronuclear) [Paramecium tetraurelia]|uniref:Uncharacterized protein n=1 Tax=Paramecium tetraurelia TaxID=5888 RepID=A0EBC5_PARTE|nr:uncharacterized protein GSPATT00025326001 [Paramecium tetraurelia]CAK92592.1 unnamed protein product [Paramecium tetraurelia]|eukprot:XP_001459989.1 hypothetical protein (macronuclear) [Paramecium tetraurelia strain d4-2]
MISQDILFFLLILQLADGFRNIADYNDRIGYQFQCNGGHRHAPGMHPHPCVCNLKIWIQTILMFVKPLQKCK